MIDIFEIPDPNLGYLFTLSLYTVCLARVVGLRDNIGQTVT